MNIQSEPWSITWNSLFMFTHKTYSCMILGNGVVARNVVDALGAVYVSVRSWSAMVGAKLLDRAAPAEMCYLGEGGARWPPLSENSS